MSNKLIEYRIEQFLSIICCILTLGFSESVVRTTHKAMASLYPLDDELVRAPFSVFLQRAKYKMWKADEKYKSLFGDDINTNALHASRFVVDGISFQFTYIGYIRATRWKKRMYKSLTKKPKQPRPPLILR